MHAEHLYIHVPFCVRRRAYCDFAVTATSVAPVDRWLDSVAAELRLHAAAVALPDSDVLGLLLELELDGSVVQCRVRGSPVRGRAGGRVVWGPEQGRNVLSCNELSVLGTVLAR